MSIVGELFVGLATLLARWHELIWNLQIWDQGLILAIGVCCIQKKCKISITY